MAFTPTASLKGSNQVFSVSPTCKGYTLRDNGFTETKSGNFQLIRSLDETIDDHRELKISTVTKNGLQTVDLYGKANTAMAVEKLEFILEGLVERGVLEVTSK